MGDTISRRRQKHFSFKKIAFCFLILFCVVISFLTINYTIPQLRGYISNTWYISPLATGFYLHKNGESDITESVVKVKIKKAGFIIKSITPAPDSYLVLLETGEKVIISSKKPIDSQISSLQLISSRFTIEGKHFVSLDLRFDRPVLVPK